MEETMLLVQYRYAIEMSIRPEELYLHQREVAGSMLPCRRGSHSLELLRVMFVSSVESQLQQTMNKVLFFRIHDLFLFDFYTLRYAAREILPFQQSLSLLVV